MGLLGLAQRAIRPRAARLAETADQARTDGRLAEARAGFEAAIAADPRQPWIWIGYGHALRAAGDLAEAAEAYGRAADLEPESPDALVLRGQVLRRTGDTAGCLDAFRKASDRAPDEPRILHHLGRALRSAGDLGAAVAAFRRADALAPDRVETLIQLGAASAETGAPAEAADALRRALRLNPDRADVALLAAEQLLLAGEPAEARAILADATARWPDEARLLHRFGEAERALGDLPAAAALFLRADTLAPDRPDTLIHLGETLAEMDRPAAAAEALRAALRHHPEREDVLLLAAREIRRAGSGADAVGLLADAEARGAPVTGTFRRERERARRAATAEGFDGTGSVPAVQALRYVMVGTTGICTASCIHCPTGKAETAHVPRVPMPMPLFARIVDEIRGLGLVVTEQISFGLFGDGLADPHVVERARLVRERLPEAALVVNTNGAAFHERRHTGLVDLVSLLSLHVESLVPAVYDRLMAPLRLSTMRPKFERIIKAFPGKVQVSVPVSRLNRDERDAIRDTFMALGAREVVFDPLSNRCRENDPLFAELAMDPQPIRCGSDVLDDLVVDCDGRVLACCQDFTRREPIGDLRETPLAEVLADMRRESLRRRFARGEHDAVSTCAICRADVRLPFSG